ncbi:MAG: CapA family protein [Treponema sp.]|nr:CapA family protein [Treponema sp.]
MKNVNRRLLIIATALVSFACIMAVGVLIYLDYDNNKAVPAIVISEDTVPEEPIPIVEPQPDFVTLVAAGDNLFHTVVYNASLIEQSYVFDPLYEYIKPYIEPADIAFINQETVLGGAAFGLSGYPQFNTPQELAQTLSAVGFDMVNHATNHSMDRGEAALRATMTLWDSIPQVKYLGIRAEQDQEPGVVLEKNNIIFGFLAYTYGTNGLAVPADKQYLVSLINREKMAEEIDALRPRCDVLVVSMHWGEEYQPHQNAGQEALAAFLAEHKVDIVLGHHPHVLQPVALIPRDGSEPMLCFYSLGNFLSAQKPLATLLGGIAYVKIQKFESHVSIAEYGVIPTVTHYEKNYTNFRVYPLHSYSEDLALLHEQTGPAMQSGYFNTQGTALLGDVQILYNPFDLRNENSVGTDPAS